MESVSAEMDERRRGHVETRRKAPYHPRMIPRLLSLLAVAWLASLASAQETFTLGEEDLWNPVSEPVEGSPEAQLAEARRALVDGQAERAEMLARTWIDRYEIHPLVAHAYLLWGDALVAQNDEYEALYQYEAIARLYAASDVFITALQREFDIANQYIHGRRRKLWGIRCVKAIDDAIELMIRIQERLPGSRLAEKAGMELADYYDRIGEKRLAADAYDLFVENYPNSEQLNTARIRLIAAHLATYKGPKFDPAGLDEAKLKIQQLQRIEPATAQRIGAEGILFRIRESEAAKLLVNARWYLQTRDPISSERTIRQLVQRYPETSAAREAIELIPRILPRLPKPVLNTLPDYEAIAGTISRTSQPSAPDGQENPDSKPTEESSSNGGPQS